MGVVVVERERERETECSIHPKAFIGVMTSCISLMIILLYPCAISVFSTVPPVRSYWSLLLMNALSNMMKIRTSRRSWERESAREDYCDCSHAFHDGINRLCLSFYICFYMCICVNHTMPSRTMILFRFLSRGDTFLFTHVMLQTIQPILWSFLSFMYSGKGNQRWERGGWIGRSSIGHGG